MPNVGAFVYDISVHPKGYEGNAQRIDQNNGPKIK